MNWKLKRRNSHCLVVNACICCQMNYQNMSFADCLISLNELLDFIKAFFSNRLFLCRSRHLFKFHFLACENHCALRGQKGQTAVNLLCARSHYKAWKWKKKRPKMANKQTADQKNRAMRTNEWPKGDKRKIETPTNCCMDVNANCWTLVNLCICEWFKVQQKCWCRTSGLIWISNFSLRFYSFSLKFGTFLFGRQEQCICRCPFDIDSDRARVYTHANRFIFVSSIFCVFVPLRLFRFTRFSAGLSECVFECILLSENKLNSSTDSSNLLSA